MVLSGSPRGNDPALGAAHCPDPADHRFVLSGGDLARLEELAQQSALNAQKNFERLKELEQQNKRLAELQQKQNELTKPIFRKTMSIIRRMATQEGFDMIVDKQAVPYVRSDLEVTDKIITLYNQGGGSTEETTKPTPTPKKPAKAK